MTEKIEIRRGRTLLLPGTWQTGDPFTSQTTLACELVKKDVQITLTVTKTSERGFEIYASNVNTGAFEKGTYEAILTRTDADFFPNGDDYVHAIEKFLVEVV